jgi:hypothetical protein
MTACDLPIACSCASSSRVRFDKIPTTIVLPCSVCRRLNCYRLAQYCSGPLRYYFTDLLRFALMSANRTLLLLLFRIYSGRQRRIAACRSFGGCGRAAATSSVISRPPSAAEASPTGWSHVAGRRPLTPGRRREAGREIGVTGRGRAGMPLARNDLYRRENGKDRDRDSGVLQCP